MGHRARWMPVAVTSAVAALMAGAAVLTANQAGCDEPGSYVPVPGGVQLVGGCVHEDDLPVGPPGADQDPLAPVKRLGD